VIFTVRQKPDKNSKDIIQQESLGTDMLQELKNSNYTKCHIELINRSWCTWMVSFHHVSGASVMTLA